MANNRRTPGRAQLAIEILECRAVPTAGFLESFDHTPIGRLPAGWQAVAGDAGGDFAVAGADHALGPGRGLTSASAASNGSGRVWKNDFSAADVQVSAAVHLDSLAPAQLFVRGQGLASDKPTYYAVSVTRGLGVQLLRVVDGRTTTLGTVVSQAYHSESWIRLTLVARGDALQVQVFRTDTAQYLTRQGTWSATPSAALDVKDTAIRGAGRVGLNRPAAYAGEVSFDNVAADDDPSDAVVRTIREETFSGNGGQIPAGWDSYTSGPGGGVRVTTTRGLVGPSSLAATGSSSAVARTWLDTTVPADAEVSAAVYLDSLNETHVFGRGRDLDGDDPDYYAVSVSRGLDLALVRVKDGRVTELAHLGSASYFSNQWVQVTLSMQGSSLKAKVYRTDTAQFLNADGDWQVAETWALGATDGAVAGPGYAGVNRPPQFAGTVSIDNFVVRSTAPATTPPGNPGGPATPAPVTQKFPFENVPAGQLPAGWTQWSSNLGAGFEVTTVNAQAGYKSLVAAGGSAMSTRAWLAVPKASDVQISAAVYLDSLVPAELIVRGTDLATNRPTYYAARVTRGLEVQLLRVEGGRETVIGRLQSDAWFSGQWAKVTLTAEGKVVQAAVQRMDTGEYLNADGHWQKAACGCLQINDATLPGPGYAGLGRPARFSGRVLFDEVTVTTVGDPLPGTTPTAPPSNGGGTPTTPTTPKPPATPGTPTTPAPGLPGVPQHYDWIRIAMLAYSGTPLTALEQRLLRESVDLVVPATTHLDKFAAAGKDSHHLIYSNVSNLYLELLSDWLNYADAKGLDREAAFYHAAKPTAWEGASASSRPVDRFWGVYTGTEAKWSDKSSDTYSPSAKVALGGAGSSVLIGNLDPFREINVTLDRPATGAWSGVWEYASAVDAAGKPTGWTRLKTLSDTTAGMNRSGKVTFDPPDGWKTASVNGTARLFYVRFRTTASTGRAPDVRTIKGRDYAGANGGARGTIPAFDKTADRDGDGYLNDAEYARRRKGFDARFEYESRLFHPYYGQHRYATNLANPLMRAWAADFNYRYLAAHPSADGVLMDNSGAKAPFAPGETLESTANYTQNYASLLAEINKKIAPRWVLGNTASAGLATDELVKAGVSYMEEFGIRPLSHNTVQFEDLLATLNRREQLSKGKTITVLDSHPKGGEPSDPRFQVGALAYYYLMVSDPSRTFLMFNGGNEPATSWSRHWTEAAKYDVGRPTGDTKLFATGADPANGRLTYKVYSRQYENALVLFKPVSYKQGVGQGTLADQTATTHYLNGTYRVVRADGTLGPAVTRVTLRNGEGAVLAKA